MAKNSDPKALASFLNCLSLLENNVSLLYKELSDKVSFEMAKSLFFTISIDSRKHSVILNGVAAGLAKVSVKPKECEKKLGEAWRVNDSFHTEIKSQEKITEEELPQLAQRLMVLESALGEEYYIFVQIQTLQLMTKEINQLYNINIDSLKNVFASIIRDEEHHREILGMVQNLLTPKEQRKADGAPFVKYQNPDSWMEPGYPKE